MYEAAISNAASFLASYNVRQIIIINFLNSDVSVIGIQLSLDYHQITITAI